MAMGHWENGFRKNRGDLVEGKTKYKMFALSFVPFIMVLGNSMLIPVFSDIKEELLINQFQVNLLISYFSLPAALLIPFLGFLSDRIGRKKVLIPSLILYGIGGVVSGFSSILFKDPYGYILAGRVIQGFGAAGTSPIAMVLVSDMFSSTERSKALGMIEASNGIGKVISPILGSLIALVAWYMIFFSYSILTIPIAIILWFVIKEEENVGEHKNIKIYFKEIIVLLKDKGTSLVLCLMVGFLSLFLLYGILANFTDILGETRNSSLMKRGFVVALPLMSMSVISYWMGGYLQNKRRLYKALTMGSLLVCGMAVGIMPYLSTYAMRFIALESIGLSVGTILTVLNTFVTSCVPPGKRGVITALYNSFRFLGISFGPIYFSDLLISPIKMTLLPMIILVITVLFFIYVKTERMLEYFGAKKI